MLGNMRKRLAIVATPKNRPKNGQNCIEIL